MCIDVIFLCIKKQTNKQKKQKNPAIFKSKYGLTTLLILQNDLMLLGNSALRYTQTFPMWKLFRWN